MKLKKMKFGMVLAVKEHLIAGNPTTQLDAIVLFGVPSLTQTISDMRKDGWVIQSQRVPYVKALTRINKYASLVPPNNLPTKEVHLTEYWINR